MTAPPPSPLERRAPLQTAANPAGTADTLVILAAEPRPGLRITLRYVPDRWIVTGASLKSYFAALLDAPGWTGAEPEALAAAVLDDIANECVPRWAEVLAETDVPMSHCALAGERQPGWDNPALLARLPPIGSVR